ncbi:MAG: calmodulin-binding protein [Pseudomonadota bacterium]
MTHLSCLEWSEVPVHNGKAGVPSGHFSRDQANSILSAAKAHPLSGKDGSQIIEDRHSCLRTKQMVGVIAAEGCSLEILPKIDGNGPAAIRHHLVSMLDLVLKLNIGTGNSANLGTQRESLLEIVIRHFADALLSEVRRGLPRRYLAHEDDLPQLRGRLNIGRQFTQLAVRLDKVASRFDALSHDIPLLQIMKATVNFVLHHSRNPKTTRRLDELRFLLAEVSDIPVSALPWNAIHINRTNYRWQSLLEISRLFLKRDWQNTKAERDGLGGLSLLFPMNDLFEEYVEALLGKAARRLPFDIKSQGGRKFCLFEESAEPGPFFQTKPDFMLLQEGKVVSLIDAKWKRLVPKTRDKKQQISQADVYQMMAYSRLYDCPDLVLLYPHHIRLGNAPFERVFRLNGGQGHDRLSVVTLDIAQPPNAVLNALADLLERRLPARAQHLLQSPPSGGSLD